MTSERVRGIGVLGTAARLGLGGFMVASVLEGHMSRDFNPGPWLLGLVVFPGVVLGAHSWASRRAGPPLRLVGPVGHCAGLLAFLALYLFEPTSDAALLFYGASMLLAAATGMAGCEVLAFSNWALSRHDELGCVVFEPFDRLDRRRRAAVAPGEAAGARS
jgi:hypothetical protein